MPVIEKTMTELTAHLTASGTGVNLIEVADGIYQQETSKIIRSQVFHDLVDGAIFAAGDAGGAYAGVQALRELGLNVLGVSGKLTRSPLAVREAEEITGVRVYSRDELMDPQMALQILDVPSEVLSSAPAPREAAWPEDPSDSPLLGYTPEAPAAEEAPATEAIPAQEPVPAYASTADAPRRSWRLGLGGAN